MGRVARALVLHEFLERTRDRWVMVISLVFALLASAVSLYGRGAEAEVALAPGEGQSGVGLMQIDTDATDGFQDVEGLAQSAGLFMEQTEIEQRARCRAR